MKKLLRNKKGFTLIELIVVILILAILAAILVPSILNYVGKATDSKNQSNARSLYSEVSIELASLAGTATLPGDTVTALNAKATKAGCLEITGLASLTSGSSFEVSCGGWVFDGTEFTTP